MTVLNNHRDHFDEIKPFVYHERNSNGCLLPDKPGSEAVSQDRRQRRQLNTGVEAVAKRSQGLQRCIGSSFCSLVVFLYAANIVTHEQTKLQASSCPRSEHFLLRDRVAKIESTTETCIPDLTDSVKKLLESTMTQQGRLDTLDYLTQHSGSNMVMC